MTEGLDKIKGSLVVLLHKHYYPTMHEAIVDSTLFDLASHILSLETDDGYSLKEMIEFFSKIDRETQRAAVVRIKAELPNGVFDYKQHERIFREAGLVQEVKHG